MQKSDSPGPGPWSLPRMDIIVWIIDAIASCFIRNDEEWNVGRIVMVSAVVIAILLLGYWLHH
jgi:hypothetical protein